MATGSSSARRRGRGCDSAGGTGLLHGVQSAPAHREFNRRSPGPPARHASGSGRACPSAHGPAALTKPARSPVTAIGRPAGDSSATCSGTRPPASGGMAARPNRLTRPCFERRYVARIIHRRRTPRRQTCAPAARHRAPGAAPRAGGRAAAPSASRGQFRQSRAAVQVGRQPVPHGCGKRGVGDVLRRGPPLPRAASSRSAPGPAAPHQSSSGRAGRVRGRIGKGCGDRRGVGMGEGRFLQHQRARTSAAGAAPRTVGRRQHLPHVAAVPESEASRHVALDRRGHADARLGALQREVRDGQQR